MAFGADDADESVVGPAEDFCLVVTQRRHVDDTDLEVTGDAARDWMLKAQAFAGAATDGPAADLTGGSVADRALVRSGSVPPDPIPGARPGYSRSG